MSLARVICFLALCAFTLSKDAPQTTYGDLVATKPQVPINYDNYISKAGMMGCNTILYGYFEEEKQQHTVSINVTDCPILLPDTKQPGEGETRIPDNDDVESVQIYLANKEGRILEIRFNRFKQSLVRFWRHPYSVLRDDGVVEFKSVEIDNDMYSMILTVPAELLPANATLLNSVLIDPTQEGPYKYWGYYRVYNYPIAADWSTRIYSMYQPVATYTLAPESINRDYSSWWDTL